MLFVLFLLCVPMGVLRTFCDFYSCKDILMDLLIFIIELFTEGCPLFIFLYLVIQILYSFTNVHAHILNK